MCEGGGAIYRTLGENPRTAIQKWTDPSKNKPKYVPV
jgi:hypothetical protein